MKSSSRVGPRRPALSDELVVADRRALLVVSARALDPPAPGRATDGRVGADGRPAAPAFSGAVPFAHRAGADDRIRGRDESAPGRRERGLGGCTPPPYRRWTAWPLASAGDRPSSRRAHPPAAAAEVGRDAGRLDGSCALPVVRARQRVGSGRPVLTSSCGDRDPRSAERGRRRRIGAAAGIREIFPCTMCANAETQRQRVAASTRCAGAANRRAASGAAA